MAFYISGPKLLFETTEISTHPNSTQQESNYIYLCTTKFGTSIKIRLNRKFESTEFETMRVNCTYKKLHHILTRNFTTYLQETSPHAYKKLHHILTRNFTTYLQETSSHTCVLTRNFTTYLQETSSHTYKKTLSKLPSSSQIFSTCCNITVPESIEYSVQSNYKCFNIWTPIWAVQLQMF